MAKFQYIFLIFSIFFTNCAVQGSLPGGERDTQAPKVDSLSSTPNFQTNFEKKDIKLTFNEWIRFDNSTNQVVVSPPLAEKPEITLSGKSVIFKFGKNEILRKNATYTINFGESISDLNEGNNTEMRFVFSTGAQIDSLKIRAQIINAFTRAPMENILFMLYDNTSDSVVIKERPFYFAKSGKDGFCEIQNVSKGKFKAFALEDANANYKYDMPNEKIGFEPKLIDSQDTTKNKVTVIELFEPQKKVQILDKNIANYGQIKLTFPTDVKDIISTWEDKNQRILRENDGDTLRIWYDNTVSENWKLYVLKDTILVKNQIKETFLTKNKFLPLGIAVGNNRAAAPLVSAISVVPSKNHELNFNFPILKIDTSKISIKEDSTNKKIKFEIKTDSQSLRKILVKGSWLEGKKYKLTMLSGAFLDFYDRKNDTIQQQLMIAQKKDFGDLTINYKGFEKNKNYIIEVFTEGNLPLERKIISNKTDGKITFSTLTPASYKIRIITDTNKNGKWDGGNYFTKMQSETIFIKVLDEMKPNWELETSIELDAPELK